MAKKQFETFRDIGSFEIDGLKQDAPSCFNGMVRVTKVRVTIEEVEEDVEVIRDRLRKMWSECTNHHHQQPILAMAKKYGLDLMANETEISGVRPMRTETQK